MIDDVLHCEPKSRSRQIWGNRKGERSSIAHPKVSLSYGTRRTNRFSHPTGPTGCFEVLVPRFCGRKSDPRF